LSATLKLLLRLSNCGSVGEKNFDKYPNTGCPTHYRTRHFFNNFTSNEDIARKFEADLLHCVRNVKEKNVLLKFRCNIFIGVRIIKEMPGSVARGTPCTYTKCFIITQRYRYYLRRFFHNFAHISLRLSKNIKTNIYRIMILPVVFHGCETWSLTLKE